MRWNKILRSRLAAWLAGLVALAMIIGGTASAYFAGAGKLTVFWRGGSYQLEPQTIAGKPYVDLLQLLQPIAEASATLEKDRYRIKFNGGRAEFQDGASEGRIGKNNVKLGEPFVVQNGRGFVALRIVPDLVPFFVNEEVDYHSVSERLFVGASARRFTIELKRTPPAVVLSFDQPVNPEVHTEAGKLRLDFLRDGVSAAAGQSWKFAESPINSANYEETASGPEITVNASEPLMANFSNGGRVITIAPAPGVATQGAQSASTQPAGTAAANTNSPAATSASPSGAPANPEAQATGVSAGASATFAGTNEVAIPHSRSLVVIDAAHGGEERGAALTGTLAEKDVALQLARRLRTELENRGVPIFMLRDNDATIPLDQRAMAVNTAHPAIYIAVHAGTLGRGVRLYTAMLSPANAASAFVPWETAQAGYLEQSRRVAGGIMQELGKTQLDFPIAMMPAPVRPLNNITGAALAIELSPSGRDPESVNNAAYQQKVATALAAAIATARTEAAR